MWDSSVFDKLDQLNKQALGGGGPEKIQKQHDSGKLTARERLEILFDSGTFTEVGGLVESRIPDFGMDTKKVPGDGVVTGYGKVNGRLVFASSEDFTVIGGTLGESHDRIVGGVIIFVGLLRACFEPVQTPAADAEQAGRLLSRRGAKKPRQYFAVCRRAPQYHVILLLSALQHPVVGLESAGRKAGGKVR